MLCLFVVVVVPDCFLLIVQAIQFQYLSRLQQTEKEKDILITRLFTWPSFYQKQWQSDYTFEVIIMWSYCFFTGYTIVRFEAYSSLQFSIKWKINEKFVLVKKRTKEKEKKKTNILFYVTELAMLYITLERTDSMKSCFALSLSFMSNKKIIIYMH